jgi:hypothetical protein
MTVVAAALEAASEGVTESITQVRV